MWLGYFGLYQVAEGGVAWTAPLWTGTAVLAGLVAGGIGLLTPAASDYSLPAPTQCGPSASCPVVLVPIGGPVLITPVSTATRPSPMSIGNRSIPRRAGPLLFPPTRLYSEPS